MTNSQINNTEKVPIEEFSKKIVQIGNVESALKNILNKIEESGFIHATYCNFILLYNENFKGPKNIKDSVNTSVNCKDGVNTQGSNTGGSYKYSVNTDFLENLISTLSLCHPSRFFIVRNDPEIAEGHVAISCRMNSISESATVCSEIIEINSLFYSLESILTILKAFMLPGVNTKLLLGTKSFSKLEISLLSSLSNCIFLDSEKITDFIPASNNFFETFEEIIDLQWLYLSSLREQIRIAFDKQYIHDKLNSISKITITSDSDKNNSSKKSLIPVKSYLLGSWILNRLNLDPISFGVDGFECSDSLGERFTLELLNQQKEMFDTKISSEISSVEFEFKDHERRGQTSINTLRLEISESTYKIFYNTNLISTVNLGFLGDKTFETLNKYFLVGESITNYNKSLSLSHQLFLLLDAFKN